MNKQLLFISLVIAFCLPTQSQICINEIVSLNYNGLVDEDNEYADWIEIYNTSLESADLSGHFLSDDKTNLHKWQFPSYTIKSQSFTVVLASGKDRVTPPLNWQTVFDWGDDWRYLVPTSEIGNSWLLPGFDDSDWLTGPSGFGNGDDDDNTIIPVPLNSVFIRQTFEISNPSLVHRVLLHIDYDDGFVAYINGVEIARANIGTIGQPVAYNAFATNHEANNLPNGGIPNLFEITNFADALVAGTNVIAIQGHNSNLASSDFTLIPFLTIATAANESNGTGHQFFTPPINYLHTNFKIDNLGETLYLTSPLGVIIDSIAEVALDADISYGRQPDGSELLYYFGTPTPGFTNNLVEGATSFKADSVIFSIKGGVHIGGTIVALSTPVETDEIFFTLDGSIPSAISTLYTTPIIVSQDAIIRARAFREFSLPGPIVTNTYIVDKQHSFPIVSISTNPENLWDYNTGIYVLGPNAEPNEPYLGANYWQDWEKPAQLEFFNKDGINVLNQGVGVKIFGGWSRAKNQKSLALFARKEYGNGSLKYKFFNDKPINQFESIVLRNSGNDNEYTFFRDGLFSTLASEMDVDRLAFQPSALYLNGEYWGIQNIREKINEHYLASNHQFDTKDLNLLTNDGSILYGSNTDYNNMVAYAVANNLQTAANFQNITNWMDINNYIQYQLYQIYIGNTDWPGNNIKFWRTNSPESKWRWILYDTDFGFDLYYDKPYNYNSLSAALNASGNSWPNPAWSTLLFRRLLTSTEFRNNFITQYCDHLNTTFIAENVISAIDSMRLLFDEEIKYQHLRWGGNYNNWLNQVERLRNFAIQRPAPVWGHLKSQFTLGNIIPIGVAVNNIKCGHVKLNSVVLRNNANFTGNYFQNIPIKLKALPKPGYKFLEWQGSVPSTNPEIAFNMSATANFNAVFGEAAPGDTSIVINEINYKSAIDFNTEDWIELFNNGKATIDLANWRLTDLGNQPEYVFPEGTILYPGDFLVVCNDIIAFRNFHPSTRNSIGSFEFGLSSTSDKIRLYNNSGQIMDSFDYSASTPWPQIGINNGATLELRNPKLDNTVAANWVANLNYGTSGFKNAGYNVITSVSQLVRSDFSIICFPTPFKDFTTIEITVPTANHYTIDVLDIYGRIVNQLINQMLEADVYYIDWDGTGINNKTLPNGVYLIRCLSSNQVKNIKVLKY